MPRTVFDKINHKYDRLLLLIQGAARVNGKTYEDLGLAVGTSARTIAKRFTHPADLTLGELTRIGRALNLPIEDIRQSIQY